MTILINYRVIFSYYFGKEKEDEYSYIEVYYEHS
jgi:hypothetical protein